MRVKQLPKKIQQIVSRSKSNGFNPVVGTIWLMMDYWKSWWRGNVNDFHHFKQKINGVYREMERRTLNTFKMSCEEWESLIWSELVQINITNNETANKRLQEVLELNNDYLEMGNLIEKYFALGNGATIVYKANGKTNIDYISGQQFIPLSYENNTMTGILTINESTLVESGKPIYITHLTYHWVEDGKYYIKHEVYKSTVEGELGDYSLSYINYIFDEQEANSMLMTITNDKGSYQTHMIVIETDTKFFQTYRPNISNNYDESTMGVSIGANMIDLHESVDIKFDASSNEILNNKTRIVVGSQALSKQNIADGETGEDRWITYLDDQDTVIMAIPMDDDTEDIIKHFQGEFRMEDIKVGINEDIQLIGWRAGFGKKYFSFEDGETYTNEKNVITSNSALYKNKKKHENLLGRELINKAKAIMYLENDMGNITVNLDDLEYEVVFDDSIINDDESKLETMKTDSMSGFIPKWRYVMKRYGLSEEEAKLWVEEAQKEEDESAFSFIDNLPRDEE